MPSGNDNQRQFHQLGVDLARFAEVTQISYETVIRRVALQIFREVIQRTPVDTGRARAGWQVTINEPGTYVPPAVTEGHEASGATGGQRRIVRGRQRMASHVYAQPTNSIGQYRVGDVVFIVNNVGYVVYLEHGSSKQAPAGMVRLTLAKIKTQLDAIIRANS